MSEASLASLPGNSLPGLDMRQVERERKDMWSRMFQKYEVMEEMDQMSEEVNLEDIDSPETVEKIFKERVQSYTVQPSSIIKQYIMEHADEMDEIATIAGHPVSDEELLSDDSEDDLLYSSRSDASNGAVDRDADVVNHMPLTPASSDIHDELSDGNNSDEANELEGIDATLSNIGDDEDINGTLVGLDEDDDLLYNAAPSKLCDSNHNPPSSQEPVNKKPRFRFPLKSCIEQPRVEQILMNSQEVTPREKVDNTDSGDDDDCVVKQPHIVCCQCLTSTFYYALPVREQLVCDECLAGDHVDCEVVECRVCKEVGELISLRRQAEVFGRVEHRKLELSSSGLNDKTVRCDEDETCFQIERDSLAGEYPVMEELLRKPCDKFNFTSSVENADDIAIISHTNKDAAAVVGTQVEPKIRIRQCRRSTSHTEDSEEGLTQHQFLPPLAQCAAGQYPSSLASLLPHRRYSLNKVYPRPGCKSGITLYYCCIKKSMGCKGKCKVKLDKGNKVELVHFSNMEHNHH